MLRWLLDEEMRPFWRVGRDENATNGLLRKIRHALGVPMEEVAEKVGLTVSMAFAFEKRELSNSINIKSMGRMA